MCYTVWMVNACDQRGQKVRQVGRPCSGRSAGPGFAYQRPDILLLLQDHSSSAEDVARRLAELSFGPSVTAKVRYVLRAMEQEGLVRFSWGAAAVGGTPRQVYFATGHGQDYLRQVTPVLIGYRDALGYLVNRYQAGEADAGGRSQH
jgi:DNA-binding PadR family transcriptional regulator